MKTPYELKQKIMRAVYRQYVLRMLSHPAIRIGGVFTMLLAIRELTFVSKVFENAALKENAVEFAAYLVSAFTGTEVIVQLLTLAVVGVTLYMLKDAASYLRPQQLAA